MIRVQRRSVRHAREVRRHVESRTATGSAAAGHANWHSELSTYAAWMWSARATMIVIRSSHSAIVRGNGGSSSSRSHSP